MSVFGSFGAAQCCHYFDYFAKISDILFVRSFISLRLEVIWSNAYRLARYCLRFLFFSYKNNWFKNIVSLKGHYYWLIFVIFYLIRYRRKKKTLAHLELANVILRALSPRFRIQIKALSVLKSLSPFITQSYGHTHIVYLNNNISFIHDSFNLTD